MTPYWRMPTLGSNDGSVIASSTAAGRGARAEQLGCAIARLQAIVGLRVNDAAARHAAVNDEHVVAAEARRRGTAHLAAVRVDTDDRVRHVIRPCCSIAVAVRARAGAGRALGLAVHAVRVRDAQHRAAVSRGEAAGAAAAASRTVSDGEAVSDRRSAESRVETPTSIVWPGLRSSLTL